MTAALQIEKTLADLKEFKAVEAVADRKAAWDKFVQRQKVRQCPRKFGSLASSLISRYLIRRGFVSVTRRPRHPRATIAHMAASVTTRAVPAAASASVTRRASSTIRTAAVAAAAGRGLPASMIVGIATAPPGASRGMLSASVIGRPTRGTPRYDASLARAGDPRWALTTPSLNGPRVTGSAQKASRPHQGISKRVRSRRHAQHAAFVVRSSPASQQMRVVERDACQAVITSFRVTSVGRSNTVIEEGRRKNTVEDCCGLSLASRTESRLLYLTEDCKSIGRLLSGSGSGLKP